MRGITATIATLMLFVCASAYAAGPNDGFSVAQRIEGRHFTVYLAPGVDESALVRSLDISPGHKIMTGHNLQGASYSPDSLGDLLDAFFTWAGGVLDMNLYSYKGNIKIVPTNADLGVIYTRLYGVANSGEKGFYIFDLNTLYASQEDFTKEIVGHEIAHGIISNFFVVQPPVKVAEVLAGYIEYQLRKISPR